MCVCKRVAPGGLRVSSFRVRISDMSLFPSKVARDVKTVLLGITMTTTPYLFLVLRGGLLGSRYTFM